MPVLDLRHAPETDYPAPDEIAVIAQHEHLTLPEAAARGHAMLREPWGHAALRQMVWDTLADARRRADEPAAVQLTDLYHRTCLRYPCPHDRRMSPARERHPFPPADAGSGTEAAPA